ncbi:glycogen-binding subunit 76A isoform X1 [Onthophagus taurus]|uniref:glycogen-binding subunit 76A isoform X1 n=3 Tax=Onthophagus taurus TaxID=166361 RepID=UPI0039BE3F03
MVNHESCETVAVTNQMTSTQSEKCGLTTLFVMSCRGRAEAFARHLQSRLSTLNKEPKSENKDEPDETTWLGKNEQITLTQPKHKEIQDDKEDDLNVSISSTEYGTCQDDLSRTLTEESFASLESDIIKDDVDYNEILIKNEYYENDTKNEDDYILENDRSSEVIQDCCDENCDIIGVDDSLTKTELLNIINIETSIPNGDCHHLHHHQDDEITPLRRCSSLRTGKTPPGTPGRKKIVRFADVLGLDLADVRTFLDEIPKIPNSAYVDLQDANLMFSSCSKSPEKILIPLFSQPGGLSDFLQRVHDNKVCLENALVEDVCLMSVKGTVRVLNLDFHKMVHVRYSVDGWRSFSDLQCTYVMNSCDGFSDKFTFLVYANMLKVGEKLEFAVRYQCRNGSFWDNNNKCNYSFQCLPSTSTMPYNPITTEEPWATAFYYHEDESNTTPEAEERHRHLAVQEYIAATLDKHKKIDCLDVSTKKTTNIFTIFIIVVVSIVFLYVQRAVYFA